MPSSDISRLALVAIYAGLLCLLLAWLSRHDVGAGWLVACGTALVVGGVVGVVRA